LGFRRGGYGNKLAAVVSIVEGMPLLDKLRAKLWMISVFASFAAYAFALRIEYPRFSRFSQVVLISAMYSIPVWFWTVTVVSAWLNASERAMTFRAICWISFNGFLFYPALVCIGYTVPIEFAAFLVFAVNTVHVIASMAFAGAPWNRTRDYRFGMAAAYGLESAFVLHLLREPFLAASALAFGLAALVVLVHPLWLDALNLRATVRKSAASAAIALAVAAWLTLAGHRFPGSLSQAAAAPDAVLRKAGGPLDRPDRKSGSLGLGGLTGVILWPEVKETPTLVAPLPVWDNLTRDVFTAPLTIPFSGEYWLFRRPYMRPPTNSFLQRGSPSKLFFKTIGGDPLFMQARQQLPLPVPLSCCERIRMEIHNADPRSASILIELILVDSSTSPPRELRLGTSPVGQPKESSEQLQFSIPSLTPIQKFDAIRVIFHRNLANMDRSARIAIDRFVLIPKGS
jgi:hypothetical protein